MRRPLIAGNWKMHKTAAQARALAGALVPRVGEGTCEVVLCPPFTSLEAVRGVVEGTAIALGAQNMHWEEEGAFTGEVSPAMLLTSGCTWVILGHSERRRLFGESDEGVNRKVLAALEAGLKPIVCVGESLEERRAGRIEEVVLGQVWAALRGVDAEKVPALSLAYEPLWAIGTGQTATPAQAEAVHALIRRALAGVCGGAAAARVRIQYGGSVKPGNAAELFARENIDGGLIGGAALEAESFAAIVHAAG